MEAILFMGLALFIESRRALPFEERIMPCQIDAIDHDVADERASVLGGEVSDYALRFADVWKAFMPKQAGDKPFLAVKSLTLGIKHGEIFGLLGTNGAGKTTAVNIAMRAISPSAGIVQIEGDNVGSDFKKAAKHLGVVTQHNTLWPNLSTNSHLRFFARM